MSKSGEWKNLTQRAKEGNYDLVEPLDYMIIDLLPNDGELVMGYYPFAKTPRHLQEEKFKELSVAEIAGCLKRLSLQDLVARVRTRGAREYGYQRKPQAVKLLREWKANQPKSKTTPDKSGVEGE